MSFSEEQHPESLERASEPPIQPPSAEPKLLTRSASQAPAQKAPRRRRQHAAEQGLQTWAHRLRKRRSREQKSRRAPHASHGKRRRPTKRLTALVVGALGLLLLAGAAVVVSLRHAVTAALPQIDGSVHAAGLHAAVTVTRDPQGVPTITASNLDDLLFAQGYTTAGDRLWQMDGLRRHAAGELAAVLGSRMIEHDRRQRFLQLRAVADHAAATLPADQRAQLEAYARGVNAYIGSHGDALPPEFRLLAYKPAPWTPRDSLLVLLAMWEDLSTEFPRKLDREALSQHLPAELAGDLYPVGSWRDKPPAAQGHDITAPHLVEQIPLDPSQSRLDTAPKAGHVAPQQMVAMDRALVADARCEGCRAGSNNWVVNGTHTASGAPMLANDMHLNLALPDLWYEAALHSPLQPAAAGEPERLDVTGFTLPGVPFVQVGRNARVAWGITNLGADVQDLRVEHLRGAGDSIEYERPDGSWTAPVHHAETITVRGGRNLQLDVLTTSHSSGHGAMETPILSPLYPGETRALSLAWTVYEPGALDFSHLALDTATDGPSLVASLQSFGGPTLNVVWADAEGHIGYHAVGLVPVRGPAIQHPRAVQAPPPTSGTPLPQDGGGEPEEPVVMLTREPHLLLSAFHPPQRRGARPPGPKLGGRTIASRPRRAPSPSRRNQPPRRGAVHAEMAPPRLPPRRLAPEAEVLPPAPPAINYTIGSPISPVPVDALDASQAWTADIPYEALPAVTDPQNGFLATANARVTPDDYPYFVTNDWADPFRVERLTHLLAGRRGLSPVDMLHLATDVHSDVNLALAQRLAYAVDHADAKQAGAKTSRVRQAANLLRAWDGNMQTGSAAAAVITAARRALWPALLVPQIAAHDGSDTQHAAAFAELYTWGERTSALELLLQHEPARWLPHGFANWNDFLTATLNKALEEAPGNVSKWQYGEIHRVELVHPLFGNYRYLGRLLGVRGSTGTHPAPGDATTLDAIGAHFGPSERFVADLASTDGGLANLTTGESANPASPWYLDQFRPWLEGWSFALPGSRAAATHSLTLLP